jgi:hypothetical protein
MLFWGGATGESLNPIHAWEGASPACRDRRTKRWSHMRGASSGKDERPQHVERHGPLGSTFRWAAPPHPHANPA